MSMRSVGRAAYQGRFAGESETGERDNSLSRCVSPRVASARKARTPSTSSAASKSQRVRTVRLALQAANQDIDTRSRMLVTLSPGCEGILRGRRRRTKNRRRLSGTLRQFARQTNWPEECPPAAAIHRLVEKVNARLRGTEPCGCC